MIKHMAEVKKTTPGSTTKRVRNRSRSGATNSAARPANDAAAQQERRLLGMLRNHWARITALATAESARLGAINDYQGMQEYLQVAGVCNQMWNFSSQRGGARITIEEITGGETMTPPAPKSMSATAAT